MTTIAVVGVGAIGAAVAAALASRGADPLLCVRRAFDHLSATGGGIDVQVPARTAVDPAAVSRVDWVLFATKAHQTESAGPWLGALCGEGTRVAVLQNGVEHIERVRPLAGPAAVVPVVVDCPCRRTAPGVVVLRREARVTAPETEDGAAFAALFEGTPVQASTTADFTTAMWRKLCVNVATGGVTTVTSRPLGVIHEDGMAEIVRGLLDECVAVARAEGARLEPAFAAELVSNLRGGDPEAVSSILADRLAGRPLESDARHGAVGRFGRKHGIETPLNDVIAALLAGVPPGS